MSNVGKLLEVQDLLGRYWQAHDGNRQSELLALLTEDVDWKLSSVRKGKSDVAQAMAERPTNRRTRHMMSNLVIAPCEDGFQATFVVHAMGYVFAEGETAPYPTTGDQAVADLTAQVRQTTEGLRISRLTSQAVFLRKGTKS